MLLTADSRCGVENRRIFAILFALALWTKMFMQLKSIAILSECDI